MCLKYLLPKLGGTDIELKEIPKFWLQIFSNKPVDGYPGCKGKDAFILQILFLILFLVFVNSFSLKLFHFCFRYSKNYIYLFCNIHFGGWLHRALQVAVKDQDCVDTADIKNFAFQVLHDRLKQ